MRPRSDCGNFGLPGWTRESRSWVFPMSPHHRYEHHAGGELPKQLLGSSRDVLREFPILWKIEFMEVILGLLGD